MHPEVTVMWDLIKMTAVAHSKLYKLILGAMLALFLAQRIGRGVSVSCGDNCLDILPESMHFQHS